MKKAKVKEIVFLSLITVIAAAVMYLIFIPEEDKYLAVGDTDEDDFDDEFIVEDDTL